MRVEVGGAREGERAACMHFGVVMGHHDYTAIFPEFLLDLTLRTPWISLAINNSHLNFQTCALMSKRLNFPKPTDVSKNTQKDAQHKPSNQNTEWMLKDDKGVEFCIIYLGSVRRGKPHNQRGDNWHKWFRGVSHSPEQKDSKWHAGKASITSESRRKRVSMLRLSMLLKSPADDLLVQVCG